MAARLALGAGVIALVAVVLTTGLGGIGKILSPVGDAFGGLVAKVSSTPVPSASPAPTFDPPSLVAPSNPYTQEPTVILRGTIPVAIAGDPAYTLRIAVAAGGKPPKVIKELAIPSTAAFTVPGLPLTDGTNDFSATIADASWESARSAVVTYVLDTEAPKVTIISPQNGATINRETVQISGKTQPLSTIEARNEANAKIVAGSALEDGSFVIEVPIADGPNGITIKATDPAGNPATKVVTVNRGEGKLSAKITASDYRIDRKSLPGPLTIRVSVTDPDGQPLEGASVLLTITLPGIPPIVPSELATDGSGDASFRTTVPKTATAGTGPVTALVKTDQFGTLTVRAEIDDRRLTRHCSTGSTAGRCAATIRPCPCGTVRIAGPRSRSHPGAGSVVGPPPVAPRVSSTASRWLPGSHSADSTAAGPR